MSCRMTEERSKAEVGGQRSQAVWRMSKKNILFLGFQRKSKKDRSTSKLIYLVGPTLGFLWCVEHFPP